MNDRSQIENLSVNDDNYMTWLNDLELRIKQSQSHVLIYASKSLLLLYWSIGSDIIQRKQSSNWGDKIINQLSKDLQLSFPEMKGFSVSNLKYMQRFYQFYVDCPIGQQAVDQLPIFNIPWSLEGTTHPLVFQIISLLKHWRKGLRVVCPR